MSEVRQRVVRVLPDVPAIDKEFDYLVPEGTEVHLGDVVRIQLHGRRVGGWVVALDVEPEEGVELRPLAKVSGRGPSADVIDLAGWAAWRWVGRRASFLRTAAPPAVVRRLRAAPGPQGSLAPLGDEADGVVSQALERDRGVLRLGPGADRYPLLRVAAARTRADGRGQLLVLCPSVGEVDALGLRLRRDGFATAIWTGETRGAQAAGEWAAAAGGATVVVGTRAAAWASLASLGRAIVLDEHDEVYQQEQAPTWHARDVVVERARRAGVPCLLVSPCPSLEALGWGELVLADRAAERASWPRTEVVDQRALDPALGPLFSPRLVELVRSEQRVLCVLNRLGRARLLACVACGTLARCEVCDAAVHAVDAPEEGAATAFACGRCDARRPQVCTECGGSTFKNLRLGVSRAREELEALVGEPVAEVTAAADSSAATTRVVIGTEAVLHRVPRADAVAFLDFDQELLAHRYRAAEEALALLARAGRVVARGSGGRGTLLVQTRTPDHPVVAAALHADPGRLARSELPLRRTLDLPPTTALAEVSGEAAPAFVEALGRPHGVRIQGPVDGRWRIAASDSSVLADLLGGVARPPGRLRLAVDPLRA